MFSIKEFFYSIFLVPIDYKGQELCESILHYGLLTGFLISLFLGIFLNNLFFTLIGCCITLFLLFFIIIFPWKFYRLNKLEFMKHKIE